MGYGELRFPNQDKYKGTFERDEIHGEGVLHRATGSTVSGVWSHGLNGKGVEVMKDETTYSGVFKDGKYDEIGSLTFKNGEVYNGVWLMGKKHG